MTHSINEIFYEVQYEQRVEWLAERGLDLGDVMEDEHGEYVMDEMDDGESKLYYSKLYLPTNLQKDYAPY